MKTTATQFSYKEALILDMKEFVDKFYSEMSVKISRMKKEQKRRIRDFKDKLKTATSASKSMNLFKQSKEYIVNSNVTMSSWASEKQYQLHKQLYQLVSESKNQLQHWESCNISPKFSLCKWRETWRIFAPSQKTQAVQFRVCLVIFSYSFVPDSISCWLHTKTYLIYDHGSTWHFPISYENSTSS